MSSEEEYEEDDEVEDDLAKSKTLEFSPGDAVQVRWRSGKKWYDAHIVSVNKKNKTYHVEYSRGKTQESDIDPSLVRSKPESEHRNVPKGKEDLYAAILNKGKNRASQFAEFEAKYKKRSKRG